jgi:hypothetical protein
MEFISESKKIIEQLTELGESIPLELLHIQQLIEQIDKNAIRIANTLEQMRKIKNDDTNTNISTLQKDVRARLCEQYAYISEVLYLYLYIPFIYINF